MDLTGHWDGMPEFICDETRPKHTIKVWLTKQKPAKGKDRGFTTVHFQTKNKELLEEFGKKIGSKLTFGIKELTRDTDERGLAKILYGNGHVIRHHSTFFPWKDEIAHRKFWTQACEVYYEKAPKGMRIVRRPLNPEYPVYIISKSRWETPLTARALEKSKTPYFMVVEPKEFFEYHKTFKDKKFKYGTILIAPENFSERGQGSIPVRNYVWDLAIKTGKSRHWLMDDNIQCFYRKNNNLHAKVNAGGALRAVEKFIDRYSGIALAGLQSHQFAIAKWKWGPVVYDTRIYSCTLIKNDLNLVTGEYRAKSHETGDTVTVPACTEPHWRGRYNEDTDLVIRALKCGWRTVLFNAFLIHKVGTMVMKGGNTDALYAGNPAEVDSGRGKMALSVVAQHPDVARVVTKWGRRQHSVNYRKCVRSYTGTIGEPPFKISVDLAP